MRFLLVLLVLSCSGVAKAHDFFFAFAEMELNEVSSRFEITLTATTHDVERALIQDGLNRGDVKWNSSDTVFTRLLENKINRHFSISVDGKDQKSRLILEGVENELTGTTRFYLSCPLPIVGFASFTVLFDFLMDTFPEQQNKLTFIYREQKQTVSFLPSHKTNTLRLH
jgi:hypothetical protein